MQARFISRQHRRAKYVSGSGSGAGNSGSPEEYDSDPQAGAGTFPPASPPPKGDGEAVAFLGAIATLKRVTPKLFILGYPNFRHIHLVIFSGADCPYCHAC